MIQWLRNNRLAITSGTMSKSAAMTAMRRQLGFNVTKWNLRRLQLVADVQFKSGRGGQSTPRRTTNRTSNTLMNTAVRTGTRQQPAGGYLGRLQNALEFVASRQGISTASLRRQFNLATI